MSKSPSGPYRRLLAGKITAARYVAIIQRAVDMRMKHDRKWRKARP